MKPRLKSSIYSILKRQGITQHLTGGGTFRKGESFGYWFALSDRRRGRIFLNDSARIEWES